MSNLRGLIPVIDLACAVIGQMLLSSYPRPAIAILGVSLAATLAEGWYRPRPIRTTGFAIALCAAIGLLYWREPRGWFFLATAAILVGTGFRAPKSITKAPDQVAASLDTIAPEVAESSPEPTQVTPRPHYGQALLFGLLAALVGAFVWFIFAKITGWRFGLVAWLLGHMIGRTVLKGAGGHSSRGIQAMAAILGGVGIMGGYYLILRDLIIQAQLFELTGAAAELAMMIFIPILVAREPEVIGGFFSLVFVAIGVYDAWRAAGHPKR